MSYLLMSYIFILGILEIFEYFRCLFVVFILGIYFTYLFVVFILGIYFIYLFVVFI